MKSFIKEQIAASIQPKQQMLADETIHEQIAQAVDAIIEVYRNQGKVLLCGNGGSAADAQHIAGEFVSKFRFHRKALPALALACNSSVLTSIGNDYEYAYLFERQIEAFARPEDIVIGISTSGNSENISRALNKAKQCGAKTIVLLGSGGGKNKEFADIAIIVPSTDTPRIQESHILIGHIICDLVEAVLFGDVNEK